MGGCFVHPSGTVRAQQMKDLVTENDPFQDFARPLLGLQLIQGPREDGQAAGVQVQLGAHAHPGHDVRALADLPVDAVLLQAIFQAAVIRKGSRSLLRPALNLAKLFGIQLLAAASSPPGQQLFFP